MNDDLYKSQYPDIVRHLSRTFVREDVEEAVDDAFLYVLRIWTGVEHEGAFIEAWRLKTVRVLLDRIEKETSSRKVEFLPFEDEEYDTSDERSEDIDTLLDQKTVVSQIRETLSEKERVVADLVMAGWGIPAIARVIGSDIKDVYKYATRAREKAEKTWKEV